MSALPALLADGWAEVVGTVVFLAVAFIIWLLQNIGTMLQKRPPQPRGPNPPAPAQGGLNDEIGEFLRKAAQRRQQQPPQQAPPREPRVQQPVRAEVAGGRQPVPAEVALQRARQAAEAARKRGRTRQQAPPAPQPSVSHTATRSRPAPAQSELAPLQEAADTRGQFVDRRSRDEQSSPGHTGLAHAGFGGALAAARPGVAPTVDSGAAVGLFALLSNPSSLRQAMVLSEVLNRPEDRW